MSHTLVALHFISNPENKPEVNHKDGNKLNNHISNLEWVTPSENRKHAFRVGLQSFKGEQHTQNKLNEMQVRVIRRCIEIGLKQQYLSALFGVSFQHISKIKKMKSWGHIIQDEMFKKFLTT